MDATSIGIVGVGAITIICLLIGMGVKASSMADKYIPIIVGACGGILGLAGLFVMPDFPASDYITAIAVGIVSGLSATGINQISKQLKKNDE